MYNILAFYMNTLFSTIPKLAKTLSMSHRQSLFLVVQFWYFFLTRKLNIVKTDMRFRFHNNSVQFDHWLRFPMDIAVLREIYLDKEYDWCPIVDPKVIIDLGAHFGDTTLYYHTRFPNARIIAVEPAPESYERLLKNTQNIKNIFHY